MGSIPIRGARSFHVSAGGSRQPRYERGLGRFDSTQRHHALAQGLGGDAPNVARRGSTPREGTALIPGWCSGSMPALEAVRAAFESQTGNHGRLAVWGRHRSYKPTSRVRFSGLLPWIDREELSYADRDSWCWRRPDMATTRSSILRRSTKRKVKAQWWATGLETRGCFGIGVRLVHLPLRRLKSAWALA